MNYYTYAFENNQNPSFITIGNLMLARGYTRKNGENWPFFLMEKKIFCRFIEEPAAKYCNLFAPLKFVGD